MVRLFSYLTAIAILMILAAGLGVYALSSIEIDQAKQEVAVAEAKSAALGLSAQINTLNKMLDKMAQDPEVQAAVMVANPVLLETVSAKLEQHLPDVLKIRILLPGVSEIDEKNRPRMGFADLDMVRETFTRNQSPGIQGDKGPDRHLAIARRIVQNGQALGVILASLDDRIVLDSLKAVAAEDIYLELRQAALVLGTSGNKISAGQSAGEPVNVANTHWEIYYQYAGSGGLVDILIITGIIIAPALMVLLAFFVGYRKLSNMLTQDLQSLMKAFKDLMTQNTLGNYPVQLTEVIASISALIQFKRVLDNGDKGSIMRHGNFDMNIIVSDDENFNDNDLFNDDGDFKL